MNASSDVATVPGWYGKLPSLGDFASRRLEADFIEPWDLWLGESLQAHRRSLGEAWLDAYLNSPPWRFLLSPGVLPGVDPARVLAGVLLPSVDRVGRYFPLTIAAAIARVPRVAAEFDALLAWLHRLEDTALDALQGDWTIDDLERALAELAPPTEQAAASEDRLAGVRDAVAAAVAGGGGFVDIASVASRAELASVFSKAPGETSAMAHAPVPAMRGIALWIADPPGQPQLLVSQGLPGHDEFARMFGGGGAAPAAAAAPGAATDDDATRPLPLEPPELAATGRSAADENDLLGLFDNAAAVADTAAPAPGAARDDDILALFGAADAAPIDAVVPEAPRDDDILAMFAVPPEPAPTEPKREGGSREPDILDLFGGRSTEPDTGKAP
ncbi:MAG: type VI secretion system-associated protein TagF [Caldimonas sp.]